MPLGDEVDCQVLEVENLENFVDISDKPQTLKDEGQRVLDMLMPSALQLPGQAFLDVEDVDSTEFLKKQQARAPMTAAQHERQTHKKRVKQVLE